MGKFALEALNKRKRMAEPGRGGVHPPRDNYIIFTYDYAGTITWDHVRNGWAACQYLTAEFYGYLDQNGYAALLDHKYGDKKYAAAKFGTAEWTFDSSPIKIEGSVHAHVSMHTRTSYLVPYTQPTTTCRAFCSRFPACLVITCHQTMTPKLLEKMWIPASCFLFVAGIHEIVNDMNTYFPVVGKVHNLVPDNKTDVHAMLKDASTTDTIFITTQADGCISIGAPPHIFAVHRQTIASVLAVHAADILTSVNDVNNVVDPPGLALQYSVQPDEKGLYEYGVFLAQDIIGHLACLNVELDEVQQVADPASRNKEDDNGHKARDDDEEIIKKIRQAARVQPRSTQRNPRTSELDAISTLVHNQDAHIADYESQIHDRPHSPSPEDADLFNDMHED